MKELGYHITLLISACTVSLVSFLVVVNMSTNRGHNDGAIIALMKEYSRGLNVKKNITVALCISNGARFIAELITIMFMKLGSRNWSKVTNLVVSVLLCLCRILPVLGFMTIFSYLALFLAQLHQVGTSAENTIHLSRYWFLGNCILYLITFVFIIAFATTTWRNIYIWLFTASLVLMILLGRTGYLMISDLKVKRTGGVMTTAHQIAVSMQSKVMKLLTISELSLLLSCVYYLFGSLQALVVSDESNISTTEDVIAMFFMEIVPSIAILILFSMKIISKYWEYLKHCRRHDHRRNYVDISDKVTMAAVA